MPMRGRRWTTHQDHSFISMTAAHCSPPKHCPAVGGEGNRTCLSTLPSEADKQHGNAPVGEIGVKAIASTRSDRSKRSRAHSNMHRRPCNSGRIGPISASITSISLAADCDVRAALLMSCPPVQEGVIHGFRRISHLSSRAKLASLSLKTFMWPWRCLIFPRPMTCQLFCSSHLLSHTSELSWYRAAWAPVMMVLGAMRSRPTDEGARAMRVLSPANHSDVSRRSKHLGKQERLRSSCRVPPAPTPINPFRKTPHPFGRIHGAPVVRLSHIECRVVSDRPDCSTVGCRLPCAEWRRG